MSQQSVPPLVFDFLADLPVVVQPQKGQVSSDAGLPRSRRSIGISRESSLSTRRRLPSHSTVTALDSTVAASFFFICSSGSTFAPVIECYLTIFKTMAGHGAAESFRTARFVAQYRPRNHPLRSSLKGRVLL
jgi:hypothetical protein